MTMRVGKGAKRRAHVRVTGKRPRGLRCAKPTLRLPIRPTGCHRNSSSARSKSSWPGSSRPSTSCFGSGTKDVDARHKAGHDGRRIVGCKVGWRSRNPPFGSREIAKRRITLSANPPLRATGCHRNSLSAPNKSSWPGSLRPSTSCVGSGENTQRMKPSDVRPNQCTIYGVRLVQTFRHRAELL